MARSGVRLPARVDYCPVVAESIARTGAIRLGLVANLQGALGDRVIPARWCGFDGQAIGQTAAGLRWPCAGVGGSYPLAETSIPTSIYCGGPLFPRGLPDGKGGLGPIRHSMTHQPVLMPAMDL